MAQLPAEQAIERFTQNEERFDKFVNDPTGYYDTSGQPVESIPAFLERVEASGAIAITEQNKTEAALSANIATTKRNEAVAAAQAVAAGGSGVLGYATQAGLFADLAHAEGVIGYVTNDTTPSKNGTYRKVGASGAGSWVQSSFDRVAMLETATTPAVNSFDLEGGYKNKFNPALAIDAKLYDFASGNLVNFATGMTFGKQDVIEGNSYVWSMPATGPGFNKNGANAVLYCFDSSGAYLGLNIAISSHPVAPTPPTGVALSDSNKTLKFTIPVGSSIAKVATLADYSSHDTAAFNAVINGMQLEIGTVKTAYEAYGTPPKGIIKEDHVPASIARVSDIDELTALAVPPGLKERYSATTVAIDGVYAYVRTKWNSTLDLVQRIAYGTNTAFNNNVVNPQDAKTIPTTTAQADTITAYASGTLIVSQGDDAAPCLYNVTYIGANHGAFFVHEVTAAGHGKTVLDVGSQWAALGTYFTILRIVDANKFWLLSENIGGAQWSFVTTSLASVSLTHHSGATNTSGFTPSADTLTQLLPAVKVHSKKIRLDGRYEISANGVYSCEFVDIVDLYDICNPLSVLSYIQSQVGGSVQPGFTDSPVTTDVRINVTYRFGSNGACSVNSQLQAKSAINLQYCGFIQALPLVYAGKTLLQYIDKLTPIVGGLKTWDFTAIEDITSTIEPIYAVKAKWADANNPPDRMAQIVKNGSTKEYGHVIGYGLQRGAGLPATRKNVSDAGFIYSSRKMYPKAITGSQFASNIMPVNTVISTIAYRSLYNFEALPNATVFTWYYDGEDIVVVLDIHATVTAQVVPLPSWIAGKNASVIDASASFSLLNSIVNYDGLLVSVSGGYGQASIRLS